MPAPQTLVVFASPHKNGPTARLLQTYLQAHDITDYALFDCYATPPAPCTDCGACKLEFTCVHRDLDTFLEQLAPCRQVIFAFPVYNGSVPAPLKALLDRFQLFFNARFCLKRPKGTLPPKQAVLLYTCGREDTYAPGLKALFAPMFTVMDTELAELQSTANTDKE